MTRRTTSSLLAALVLALAGALTGCGSGSSSSGSSGDSSAGSSAEPSTGPSASAQRPAFDPCDGLRAGPVSRALGWDLEIDRGTKSAARCALIPRKKGGPTYALNYLWFGGGLDAAFDTMKIPAGTVTKPHVPGADAARLIVQRTRKAYYVSGFIQNGDLIQSLNGIALKPYDAAKVRRAAVVLLGEMAANAPSDAAQRSASPSR